MYTLLSFPQQHQPTRRAYVYVNGAPAACYVTCRRACGNLCEVSWRPHSRHDPLKRLTAEMKGAAATKFRQTVGAGSRAQRIQGLDTAGGGLLNSCEMVLTLNMLMLQFVCSVVGCACNLSGVEWRHYPHGIFNCGRALSKHGTRRHVFSNLQNDVYTKGLFSLARLA